MTDRNRRIPRRSREASWVSDPEMQALLARIADRQPTTALYAQLRPDFRPSAAASMTFGDAGCGGDGPPPGAPGPDDARHRDRRARRAVRAAQIREPKARSAPRTETPWADRP